MSVSRSNELSAFAGVAGGFAPLDSGLLVPRAYLPQIAGLLHNMAASAAPTVNDDSGDGYGVGARWLDTTNDVEYVCLDASSGAAVWRQTSPGLWTTYTPAITATGGGFSLGNGTVFGKYRYIDPQKVNVVIHFIRGSTTSNGTGEYLITIPVAGATLAGSLAHSCQMPASLLDSGSRLWAGVTHIKNSTTEVAISGDWTGGSDWGPTVPFTLATGDEMVVTGEYPTNFT